MDGIPLYLDGVHISSYACTCELASGTQLSGIGTACHEFSHGLGLPDLYNTANNKNLMMARWDLMSTGCYNDDSWCPVAMSAYERAFCGWLTPTVLTADTVVSALLPLSQEPQAFLVRNDADDPDADEYYLLENRQPDKWDSSLPGRGMLVWHIDYDRSIWIDNAVNNDASHYRIDIIPAAGTRSSSTAPYPYTWGTTSLDALTDTTTPAATVFNTNVHGTNFMGKPITAITQLDDGNVSFRFSNERMAADVNGDGIVNVGDIMAIINVMARPADAKYKDFADVNGDGVVNVGDIMAVINNM